MKKKITIENEDGRTEYEIDDNSTVKYDAHTCNLKLKVKALEEKVEQLEKEIERMQK